MQEDKMTFENFSQLSLSYRAQYTWAYGAMLTTKTDGIYSHLLYQVESFYVKVGYNQVNNCIDWIEPFEYNDYLDTYLGKTITLNDMR